MVGESDRLRTALVDRYAIERELGAGGMATVYLAHDLKHHRQVALKVLRPELATALGPERFLREIETTAHLTHPHILPLLDSGEADSRRWWATRQARSRRTSTTRPARGSRSPMASASGLGARRVNRLLRSGG